jgi:uncharacterized protein YjiS (DUF1127 family)
MFAIVKEDRVKQPLYRSNGVVRGRRPNTRAAWLRATSYCADRTPQETQRQASPHRLSGFLSGVRAALRQWRQRRNGRLELARLDERMLRDIGLTRVDAEYEINKPFWRE